MAAMVIEEIPGHPAEHEGVTDPVADRVEEGTPHARLTGSLRQGSVEQVGDGRTDEQTQAESEPSGPDRPGRRYSQQQAKRGQMVGRKPSASEQSAYGLHRPVDTRTETTVKHW